MSHRPRLRPLGVFAFISVAGYGITQAIRLATGRDHLFGLVRWFDASEAWSLPGIALATLGLVASLACLAHARSGRSPLGWRLLGLVFAAVAIEDVTRYHQAIDAGIRRLPGLEHLSYGWAIPLGLLLLLCVPAISRSLRDLDPGPRSRARWGVLIYAVSLIGLEGLKSVWFARRQSTADAGLTTLAVLQAVGHVAGLVLLSGPEPSPPEV